MLAMRVALVTHEVNGMHSELYGVRYNLEGDIKCCVRTQNSLFFAVSYQILSFLLGFMHKLRIEICVERSSF